MSNSRQSRIVENYSFFFYNRQEEKELVALTVAEPMPRLAIRLKNMLAQLPLL